jgi:hypothetical protein
MIGLKVQYLPRFPSRIIGGPGIGAVKVNSNWTVSLDYADLPVVSSYSAAVTDYVLLFDSVAEIFFLAPTTSFHHAALVLPNAPVLSVISVSGSNASLAVDVDNTIGVGDSVRLQVAATGTGFASPVSDTTHTITAPEDAANEIDLNLSLLNGTYDARADVTVVSTGLISGWSNTVTFTISVAYVGPGDVVSGATAWASPARAYNAAYATGSNPCMDLVDQAGANPITINILSTGFVDVTSINNWVTAHSVSTILVTKLYDQTGNGRHFTQATLGNMPPLGMSAINGLPGLLTANATVSLLVSPNVTVAQPFTLSAVGKRTAVAASSVTLIGAAASSVALGWLNAANEPIFSAGSTLNGVGADGSFHALQGVGNGASSVLTTDGTDVTGVAGANTFSAEAIRLVRGGGFTTPDGYTMEAGLWPIGFNGTQRTNMNANQHGTNGYNF